MIPYLLAALGGYFIGESQKKETDAPKMASGGQVPRYFRVSFMGDNYGTTAWGHTESEAINNARKSLKLGDDVEVKDIVEIKFRNGVPVSEWAKELRDKGRQFEDGGVMAKGGETGAASMKIKLKDGVISVYHSEGSKLLSWKAKKGDWDKIWDRLFALAKIAPPPSTGSKMAEGGETGAASMKIKLKDGVISVYHSEGSKLLSWKAKKGDWDKIWDRLFALAKKISL